VCLVKERKMVDKNKKVSKKSKSRRVAKSLVRDFKTEKEIAMDFAEKVQKKFDRLVKASVLFGSQTDSKGGAKADSDIDIILIVDDAAVNWDLELVAWYREELGILISNQKYAKELHINTVKLTTWWQDMLHGDPVVLNILRYGEALIDYGGFFNPLKALLLNGKVRSTPEAVYAALQRVPNHISRSIASELSAIEGAYWAMVDSAHAALITAGKMPPSPDHIPGLLKETFVDTGMLKMKYIKAMRELYMLHKAIVHRRISNIKGSEIDEWQKMAEEFLIEITKIIDILLARKSG